jgi:hypothetical protein
MKNVDSRSAALAAAAMALTATAAHAAVIVVPTLQPTIQAAINVASHGDTVLVLDGVYTGAGNHTIDFMGKNITLQSAGGPDACTINVKANQADQRGAFYLHSGETNAAVIEGFTITGGWLFNGPAMLLFNSSPTVRNCVFSENHADCWGGALYFDSNTNARFESCQFVDNYSTDDGGAVFGFNGSPSFTNCLFANNEAPSLAGAIFSYGSNHAPRLVNCTITGNHAMFGAAIYSNNLRIENTIIWGNTGDNDQIYIATNPSTLSVRYSNVQGGFAGVGNINVSPQFGDPLDNDFHLMPGSECIDAGDPATVVPEGTFDPDGDPRLFGVRIDMGVDEFRRTGDATGDHVVNADDLVEVVLAWGPCTWSLADLNHDFQVNADDMIIVILNWG